MQESDDIIEKLQNNPVDRYTECSCEWYKSEDEKYRIDGACIFHCEKDSWYKRKIDEKDKWYFDEKKSYLYERKIYGNGNKIRDWSNEMSEGGKVRKFWEAMRQRIKKEKNDDTCRIHDFSGVVFPEFEDVAIVEERFDSITEDEMMRLWDETPCVRKDYSFWECGDKPIFYKKVDFSSSEFLGRVLFSHTKFDSEADFTWNNFIFQTDFSNCRFMNKADFMETNFFGEVIFNEAIFSREASFYSTLFAKDADFKWTKFLEYAFFSESRFFGRMNFTGSEFGKGVTFGESSFRNKADFSSAVLGCAVFSESKFKDKVSFFKAQFNDAYFVDVLFFDIVNFQKAYFFGRANFWRAFFSNEAIFHNSSFHDSAIFNDAVFSLVGDFSLVHFSSKNKVLFENTKFIGNNERKRLTIPSSFFGVVFSENTLFRLCNLSNVSFLQANIEKACFDECLWNTDRKLAIAEGKNGDNFKKLPKENNGCRNMFWDEYVIKNSPELYYKIINKIKSFRGIELGSGWNDMLVDKVEPYYANLEVGKVSIYNKFITYFKRREKKSQTYYQVANINRQMKKNFDNKKDYQIADDFYVGEMEMFITALHNEGGWRYPLKNKGKLFFLWFYRNISNYNSNPFQALVWLFGLSVYFYFLYSSFLLNDNVIAENAILHAFFLNSTALHFSFTSTIPLLSFPVDIKDYNNGIIIFIHYTQQIFSTIVWSLLILSIHRKFKR